MAERLAAHCDFTFIQPFGMRDFKVSDLGRVLGRLRSASRAVKANARLHVRNPFFIPLTNDLTRRINRRLVGAQLRPLFDTETIVWVAAPSPFVADLLADLDYGALVYEMMDDYSRLYPTSGTVSQVESWLASKADLIIVTSEALREKARALNAAKDVELVGNGVDFAFFNEAAYERPEKLKGMKSIAGYIGTIGWWMDFEMIDAVAEACSGVDFVFAGPVRTGNLPDRRNIHFLGSVPYQQVPAFCSAFDVCLIPFVPGPFADAVNPVKLYEYFALGKPVVAPRMRELQRYSELVYLAEDAIDFGHKVSEALGETSSNLAQRRREVARMNDWSVKVEQLLGMLSEVA
ncbi:MAG: glycosyltransferase [Thermodesulfobacteriota bacterium]